MKCISEYRSGICPVSLNERYLRISLLDLHSFDERYFIITFSCPVSMKDISEYPSGICPCSMKGISEYPSGICPVSMKSISEYPSGICPVSMKCVWNIPLGSALFQ